jgi:hypothetical protein
MYFFANNIIYRCIVPLFKSVISGKEFFGEFSSMVKSLIAALIIFLLPGLFDFFFNSDGECKN